jgi:hypothetical protein
MYTAWQQSPESCLLWITAKAGCGKTTVAAHISQMVCNDYTAGVQGHRMVATKPVVLSFFFRKSNQAGEKTALAALQTIASQLVIQEPQVFPTLLDRYKLLSAKGKFEWSWENLSGVMRQMLQDAAVNNRIYMILDAIDECETKSQMTILDWVKGLVNKTNCSDLRGQGKVFKILATSRPDRSILDHLYGFPILEIARTDTAHDIRELIRTETSKFARRRNLNSSVTRHISEFLEANAQGMFLWVVLVIKELEKRDE